MGDIDLGAPDESRFIIMLDNNLTSYTPGSYETPPGMTYINDSMFLSSNQYNVSFLNEEDGAAFDFDSHNVSFVDVLCPNLGSDRITLNSSTPYIEFSVMEQPILSVKTDSGNQIRDRQLPPVPAYTWVDRGGYVDLSGLDVDYYLLDNVGYKYLFSLLDYTGQFGNSTLKIDADVGGSVVEVFKNTWDIEKKLVCSLQNDTPYKLQVIGEGGVRDFGFQNFQADDLTKDIMVTDIQFGQKVDQFDGGASMSFTDNYASCLVSLNYNRTDGTFEAVNYSVWVVNETPYRMVYSVNVSNTASGTLSYTLGNCSQAHYVKGWAINNGKLVSITDMAHLINESAIMMDLDMPVTGIGGVQTSTLYNALSIIVLCGVALAFTQVNAGVGAIVVVGGAVLFDRIGWLSGQSWMVLTMLFLLAVAYKLTEGKK